MMNWTGVATMNRIRLPQSMRNWTWPREVNCISSMNTMIGTARDRAEMSSNFCRFNSLARTSFSWSESFDSSTSYPASVMAFFICGTRTL
jgi:hypothetical protein